MNTQPDALKLADAVAHPHQEPDWKTCEQAAAELRRLHALNQELVKALNAMLTHMGMDEDEWNKPTFDQARNAIAKAEGK